MIKCSTATKIDTVPPMNDEDNDDDEDNADDENTIIYSPTSNGNDNNDNSILNLNTTGNILAVATTVDPMVPLISCSFYPLDVKGTWYVFVGDGDVYRLETDTTIVIFETKATESRNNKDDDDDCNH